MSKQILVQAQADHIATLFRGSPLAAVEELIWNGLDADAREIRVELVTNALGAVEAVRVSDDGTGIDVLKADQTFGNLGGSWKRAACDGALPATALGRDLHGRHGCGRFRAFALGCHVEWRTTMRVGRDLLSYRITGDAERPGVFELESTDNGFATGTEVYVTNVRANSDALLDAAESVRHLSAKFALYLKRYPDAHIFFNGLPVTPVIVQERVTECPIQPEGGAAAKLEIIEWKGRFAGAGRIVFAGTDGFALHEQPAGVRAPDGTPFTAYLVSPRLSVLHEENALVMDELNPEVRALVDATRQELKRHFADRPVVDDVFDKAWTERLTQMSDPERQRLLALLKRLCRKTKPRK